MLGADVLKEVICPYCSRKAENVGGRKIYPFRADLAHRRFYLCRPCSAYVGTHEATGRPLGTLANDELRAARRELHEAFDEYWREGYVTRSEAYRALSELSGVPNSHIGHFDLATCAKVLDLWKPMRKSLEAASRPPPIDDLGP